jgi:NAD(P)-dependent dehydrogenase (short-subunit alcohol dehydrogenase family)
MKTPKTVIVTGASQGIGACLVKTFLERGYQVVATARSMEQSGFQASKQLALVDGDIGEASTAKNVQANGRRQKGETYEQSYVSSHRAGWRRTAVA